MNNISRLTQAISTGIDRDSAEGAVTPPLYLSSNFSFAGFGEPRTYDYTRSGNPTRSLLAEAIATLEGAASGVVTATGLAAVTLVCHTFLKAGDTIVIPHDCYGGTWRLVTTLANRGHFTCTQVDFADLDAVKSTLVSEKPAVVWIETPSNPLLRITDIQAVSTLAKESGATVVADNTFLSPLLQQPLELGCDVVLHSTTKYLNGHSDVVGGAVVAKDESVAQSLREMANNLGLTGSPFDAYLTLRGIRSLHTRMRAHQENTEALVAAIKDHPAVAAVYYPGLEAHPGHEIAKKQQKGYGAMLSLELAGGEPAVRRFLDGLQVFVLAESLGGTESLVAHPPTMTHLSMSPEARELAGIREGLLRFSVGIEASDDLIADMTAGLDRAAG